jgi:hypothetical protein
MPLAIGMFFEPLRKPLDGKRPSIESDWRIQDVVVIDLGQPGQIGEQRRPRRNVTHSKVSPRAHIQQCAVQDRKPRAVGLSCVTAPVEWRLALSSSSFH